MGLCESMWATVTCLSPHFLSTSWLIGWLCDGSVGMDMMKTFTLSFGGQHLNVQSLKGDIQEVLVLSQSVDLTLDRVHLILKMGL